PRQLLLCAHVLIVVSHGYPPRCIRRPGTESTRLKSLRPTVLRTKRPHLRPLSQEQERENRRKRIASAGRLACRKAEARTIAAPTLAVALQTGTFSPRPSHRSR